MPKRPQGACTYSIGANKSNAIDFLLVVGQHVLNGLRENQMAFLDARITASVASLDETPVRISQLLASWCFENSFRIFCSKLSACCDVETLCENFSVQRSAFSVQRSAFSVQRSAFSVNMRLLRPYPCCSLFTFLWLIRITDRNGLFVAQLLNVGVVVWVLLS
jgi:hypothetical protein